MSPILDRSRRSDPPMPDMPEAKLVPCPGAWICIRCGCYMAPTWERAPRARYRIVHWEMFEHMLENPAQSEYHSYLCPNNGKVWQSRDGYTLEDYEYIS